MSKNLTKNTKETTMLSLRKAVEITNGRMYQKDTKGTVEEIKVKNKTIRTTNSARPKNGEELVIGTANIQESHYATLNNIDSVLLIGFKIKFKEIFDIEMISKVELEEGNFVPKMRSFLKSTDINLVNNALMENSFAYAYKIATGQFGWRNADLSVNTSVNIIVKAFSKSEDSETITSNLTFEKTNYCNPKAFNTKENSFRSSLLDINSNNIDLESLTNLIYKAFKGEIILTLEVEGSFDMGMPNAEIYPSQLMGKEKASDGKNEMSKLLFEESNCAAITSQKIGNALRRYDSFNSEGKEIAIEPLGVDLSLAESYRTEHAPGNYDLKNTGHYSFYKLMDLVTDTEEVDLLGDKGLNIDSWIYILGNIIRGGVFGRMGAKGKKEK